MTGVADGPPTSVSYAIKGTPNAPLNLVVWNGTADGRLAKSTPAVKDGVASFTVPLQAVFALTTKELGPCRPERRTRAPLAGTNCIKHGFDFSRVRKELADDSDRVADLGVV